MENKNAVITGERSADKYKERILNRTWINRARTVRRNSEFIDEPIILMYAKKGKFHEQEPTERLTKEEYENKYKIKI